MTVIDAARLDFVFGEESSGTTPEERAATSDRTYVRSQLQLAFHSPGARGVEINAKQALRTFGIDLLERVAADGAVGIVADAAEPAWTLRLRRQYLRIARSSLANAARVSVESVQRAETPGTIVPIRELDRIAQALTLDERVIGFRPEALGDKKLGGRLRDLNPSDDRDDGFIITLADAAWVIARQAELSHMLGADEAMVRQVAAQRGDYDRPTYRKGYDLAEEARRKLGLSPVEPVSDLRALIERRLGVPVLEADFDPSIAGATIISGRVRGIALGPEHRPLVKRMTLAHELGHLLYDPDAVLDRVRIDRADEMHGRQHDPVELRASAFAVAFLAPFAAVDALLEDIATPEKVVIALVERYGISTSAAVGHVKSRTRQTVKLDYHPPRQVYGAWRETAGIAIPEAPISRRGRFAELVLEGVRRDVITAATAAAWLRIDPDAVPIFLRNGSVS